ncbi:MAG: amino acid permease, partial [Desulfosudaceae bacterium]
RRLGYVVGSGGLFQALIILALANAISVLTSVSLSAVATNLRVKGGGDYYLISRTLGLEFGGAIGIVLFLAQSVSIGFYCIGFGEVLAAFLPDSFARLPQLIAAAAVFLLFVFAWLGTDWAARFQFGVMAIMAAALISFFVGGVMRWDTALLTANLAVSQQGPPFWIVFAIFFPAVTGFTQGVSMSGELKNPSRSLPNGTFAAVGLSLLIYILAAIVLAASLPREVLTTDYNAMKQVALIDQLVLAGVIAATLSSGMASFMGAPRIMQSLAADRIFPFLLFFARGVGPTSNPRRGVMLSCGIALATIALGNLNLIAPVVSMFFLISYGLLNYATYFEARAASPSFRPTFRFYHQRLSLAGGLACLGAMLAIDLTAGIMALALLLAVYQYVKRTAGPARWADSRRSYHFYRIRQHLLETAEAPEHPRDWRPALLIFSDDHDRRKPLLYFADWIQGDSGFATLVRVIQGEGTAVKKEKENAAAELAHDIHEAAVDIFPLALAGPDIRLAIQGLVQGYGIGPLTANTALTNWIGHEGATVSEYRSRRFGIYLRTIFRQGLNIMLFSAEPAAWKKMCQQPADKRRIDVWWRGDGTSRLMLLLAHMICQNEPWEKARIRVLDVCGDALTSGRTVADLGETLAEIRIAAEPEIVASANADAVVAYSRNVALVFLPFRLVENQPKDLFGNDLGVLLNRLPVTAAVLAARDIDLAADPEAGQAGLAAEVLDRLEEARKKQKSAEKAAEKASRAAEDKMEEWRRALEAGEDAAVVQRLGKEAVESKNEAVHTARTAAKTAARVESLVKEAEHLGFLDSDMEQASS